MINLKKPFVNFMSFVVHIKPYKDCKNNYNCIRVIKQKSAPLK